MVEMTARGILPLPACTSVLHTKAPYVGLYLLAATVVAATLSFLPSSVTVSNAKLRASFRHRQSTPRRLETGSVVRVACVGASITEGIRGRTTSRGPYPDQLADLLGSGYKVKNFGKGDRSVLKPFHMTASHNTSSYWSDAIFQEAKDYNPDIVVLQFGADDTKFPEPFNAHYETDYGSLAQAFMNLPSKPRVLVLTPPPVYKGWGIADKWLMRQEFASGLASHLGAVTERNRMEPPVGVFSAFQKRCPQLNGSCPWLMHEDGLHPNYEGYKFIARLVYIRIRSTGSGCPAFHESSLRCNEILPQDRQAVAAAHCKSLGCCQHDGSEMKWCDWATSNTNTSTSTSTNTHTNTNTNTAATITETATNTTTQTLDISTTNTTAQVSTTTSTDTSTLTTTTTIRQIVLSLSGTTAVVPALSSSLATNSVASTTTTTTVTTASAHLVISGGQGFALTTTGPEMLARNISPDSITFFGPCSALFASVALISVWCYRSTATSTSANKYVGVPLGSGNICKRPGCERLTWNGRPGEFCSHRCRKAAASNSNKREGGGDLPSPWAPLLSEASAGDGRGSPSMHANDRNFCLMPGCGKPTWNGQPGFCSAECYDEMEREQQVAHASAPPPDCLRPGCGKPTWNGEPDQFCSKPCREAPTEDAACLRPGCGRPTWNGRPNAFCSRGCRDDDQPS